MSNVYLQHYGVKGMRWGVRKTKNETDTSNNKTSKTTNDKSRILDEAFSQTIKRGKDKSNISPAEKISKDSYDIVSNISNVVSKISKKKSNKNEQNKISKMSNDELSSIIKRLELEKRYSDLNQQKVSKGAARVNDILDIAGSAMATVGSAMGIATTVKYLLDKRK